MEGNSPAPWFVEVNGQKQGPYTSEQIMKLLMDGALKVESRIFDTAANAWRLASDVIPYLELPPQGAATAKKTVRKTFTPPPRPTELRDVHVVDLNAEATGEVDYFALINDQRRLNARAQPGARPSPAPVRQTESERARSAQNTRGGSDRTALNEARRSEPAKITRVAPPLESSVASAITANPAAEENALPKPGADGILVAEVEPGIGFGIDNVILFSRRVRKAVRAHKGAVAVAASLALVFVGTYGMVRVLADRQGREPANVTEAQPPVAAEQPSVTNAFTRTSGDLGNGAGELGHGRHPIHRHRILPLARRVTQPLPANAPAPSAEPLRDPPQYYNSSEDTGAPVAVSPSTPPNQGPSYIGTVDPNSGVVTPPNFNPPPTNFANPADVPPSQ